MAATLTSRDAAVTAYNSALDALWTAAVELAANELALDKTTDVGGRFGQPVFDQDHWLRLKHPRYTGTFGSIRFTDAVRSRALQL